MCTAFYASESRGNDNLWRGGKIRQETLSVEERSEETGRGGKGGNKRIQD